MPQKREKMVCKDPSVPTSPIEADPATQFRTFLNKCFRTAEPGTRVRKQSPAGLRSTGLRSIALGHLYLVWEKRSPTRVRDDWLIGNQSRIRGSWTQRSPWCLRKIERGSGKLPPWVADRSRTSCCRVSGGKPEPCSLTESPRESDRHVPLTR